MDEELKESYINRHSTTEDPLLAELNRQTWLRMLNPRMLSGPYQGKLLELTSHMINPERILEIGTFTAYSSICMARGLKKGGILHTIEINDEIRGFAEEYIRRAGMEKQIIIHNGNALDIIPGLKEVFDLVFIDGEKTEYCAYYKLILPKVRNGGFIIADNVLWSGKVYDNKQLSDETTIQIRKFNSMIAEDDRVENLLLPVRDGLMIIRKK